MTAARRRACLIAVLAAAALVACQASPITGRQQFVIVSDAYAADLGVQAFRDIQNKTKVSNDPELNAAVERAGRSIVEAAGMANCDWEFRVFEDRTPNAFALPGCKVGVNTGLFRVVEDEDELAAVIGHEVAHVALHHSAERISQQIVAELGLTLVTAGARLDEARAEMLAQVVTVGAILPFSRQAESEADAVGLRYMVLAGYDPEAAIDVWENFARIDGGQKPPEYLSTHPSDERRLAQLRALVDRYYAGEMPR